MKIEFELSMMGEMKFFLELQIKQTNDKIFLHQTKYVKELLRKSRLDETKIICIPMHPSTSLNLEKRI